MIHFLLFTGILSKTTKNKGILPIGSITKNKTRQVDKNSSHMLISIYFLLLIKSKLILSFLKNYFAIDELISKFFKKFV